MCERAEFSMPKSALPQGCSWTALAPPTLTSHCTTEGIASDPVGYRYSSDAIHSPVRLPRAVCTGRLSGIPEG